MKIIDTEKVIIKSWCENPEEGAIEQAKVLANLPFVFRSVNLMPDCHTGYGMPIGGVIGTKGVVIPNAVGVDIGCGMAAVKTSFKVDQLSTERLKEIMSLIRKKIPVGFNKHKEMQIEDLMPIKRITIGEDDWVGKFDFSDLPICYQEYNNARKSLGTLGGGNHFIEIQKGDDGHIWFMVHSGSRNLGKKICDHYNAIATELNKKWYNYTKDLAFLPIDSDEGQQYLAEMNFALEFAQANRDLMVERIKKAFMEKPCPECNANGGIKGKKCEFCSGLGVICPDGWVLEAEDFEPTINIHHNYAAMEHHFGQNVMVHRKGATKARLGEIGIIPGSQGTSSYIVRGLGNPESFHSCSHGAGRTMGRKQAIRELDLDTEIKAMEEKGIIHSVRGKNSLDEAPSAYKDIQTVMEEQKDLVEIVTKLEPLGVIKG